MDGEPTFTAFLGARQLAHGDLEDVARAAAGAGPQGAVQIFDDASGRPVELDPRLDPGQAATEHRARQAAADAPPPRRAGRGRPRLGVVAREVTLLPRHWDWLAGQPGGASATLRRLVEDARRQSAGPDERRARRDAVYRIMAALAGDAPGFEDASRALFADDLAGLERLAAGWPADVAGYVLRLARPLAGGQPPPT